MADDKKPDAPETPAPTPADAPIPEKRGRGRPAKDKAAAPVSPTEASAAAAPKSRPKKGRVVYDREAKGQLAKQVEGLHKLAAMGTGIPELEITSAEAEMLGDAIANVCEEYDLSLSGKTGALLQLVAAAGMIYAPKFVQIGQRVKQQAQQRKAAELRVVGGTDTARHDGADAPDA
jgi:hypothetical protein